MAQTFETGPNPIRMYVDWNGSRTFVRLKAHCSYKVVKDWPEGQFPVSQQRFEMSEAFYKTLSTEKAQPRAQSAPTETFLPKETKKVKPKESVEPTVEGDKAPSDFSKSE